MRKLHHYWLPLFICVFVGCNGSDSSGTIPDTSPGEFANPQRVMILGYSDHAMEPFISRDGMYLFFNNLNDPTVDTKLHWAERIDDLSFQYKGESGGVNTSALEAVPSMDRNNVFYFVSTRSYDQTLSTIYRGTFADGVVSGVELVLGISALMPGMVNFGAMISSDGNTLYFVDSQFGPTGPLTADLVIAERTGASFSRVSNSAAVMKQINTKALEYGTAIAKSGLEIFFTRVTENTPTIYTATRSNTSEPFGAPKRFRAISGFVEGPTLSPDEKSLYYHKKDNDKFVIYRVTRP